MRLRFFLQYRGSDPVPINYNYFLSSAIYKLLEFGKPEFSKFLHDRGYSIDNKSYKLFTFSLQINNFNVKQGKIEFLSPSANLFVSSPIIDDFLKGMVIGAFRKKTFSLIIEEKNYTFSIEQIEEVPKPSIEDGMKFTLLSPLVLSTHETDPSKNGQYYLRFSDNIRLINKVLNNNLKNKYMLIKRRRYEDDDVNFEWDREYINKALSRNKRITKKITIYSGNNIINIIGNLAPFTIKGNPELIEIGYEAGFGEKNSMGFGMAKVVDN